MIYRAKPGTHSYAWIKQTVEARHAAFACYLRRVEQAVGFELGPVVMRTPNSSFDGRFTIERIGVTPERFDQLSRRVWKQTGTDADGTILVRPIRRTRQGRLIAQAMDSCAPLPNFLQIHAALHVHTPLPGRFSLTRLSYIGGHAFVSFDDSIRAEKENDDLEEITRSEFERIKEETEKNETK